MSKLSKEDGQIDSKTVLNAHDGWIWDLTAIRNNVYSCSWDRSVKAWDMTNTGLLPLTSYDM